MSTHYLYIPQFKRIQVFYAEIPPAFWLTVEYDHHKISSRLTIAPMSETVLEVSDGLLNGRVLSVHEDQRVLQRMESAADRFVRERESPLDKDDWLPYLYNLSRYVVLAYENRIPLHEEKILDTTTISP